MRNEIQEHNQQIAKMLYTLADYVLLSDEAVKLKWGVKFRLGKNRIVIPVLPAGKASLALAQIGLSHITNIVQKYQASTGKTDGDEILEMLKPIQAEMSQLTKS